MSTGRQAAEGLRVIADDLEAGKLELLEWLDEAEIIDVTKPDDEVRNYRPGPRRRLSIEMRRLDMEPADESIGEKSEWP